jgi:hypothetical protein
VNSGTGLGVNSKCPAEMWGGHESEKTHPFASSMQIYLGLHGALQKERIVFDHPIHSALKIELTDSINILYFFPRLHGNVEIFIYTSFPNTSPTAVTISVVRP